MWLYKSLWGYNYVLIYNLYFYYIDPSVHTCSIYPTCSFTSVIQYLYALLLFWFYSILNTLYSAPYAHTHNRVGKFWRTFWVHGAINQNHKCLNHSFASQVSDNLLLTHQFYDMLMMVFVLAGDLPIEWKERNKKQEKS